MKKNMSVIVLLIEIAAISFLHAAKIRKSEKTNQNSIAASHFSSPDSNQKIKPAYILVKMVK